MADVLDPARVVVRVATEADADSVLSILAEAARWLDETGQPMWSESELDVEEIGRDVRKGSFVLAEHDGVAAGTLRFQLTDLLFWPDIAPDGSAYIHRFAVRRAFSGGSVSTALLRWAARRAAELGRGHLRLDCDASRPRLRLVYERFGFRHHSDRQVGPWFVARYELPTRSPGDRVAPPFA